MKLLAAYGSGMLVLGVVWLGIAAIDRAEVAQQWVDHSAEVRSRCDRLEIVLIEARLSQVALLAAVASGKMPQGLDTQTAAQSLRKRVTTEFAVLNTLVVDNAEQLARVNQLIAPVDAIVVSVEESLRVAHQAGAAPSDEASGEVLRSFLGLFDDGRQREEFATIRQIIGAIGEHETTLLVERRTITEDRQRTTRIVLLTGGALAFLLVTYVIARIRRTVVDIEQANATIAQQKDELVLRTRELEQTVKDLDQFAYVASHDLKAPLRGISNLAQWIEEDGAESLGPEGREHLRLMQVRVKRMEALVDGVLAYARAGRQGDVSEVVDVGQLVREVIDMVSADGPQIEVETPLPGLRVVRVPLQQVWLNLVSNAVKYGRRGEDPARVHIGMERDASGEAAFYVRDEGPGIDPRFHDKVFGLFQTLAPRDKVESTGIGLAVVKKLVERQGGRVWVESVLGQGTTFKFTYPAARGEAVATERPSTQWRWRPRERTKR